MIFHEITSNNLIEIYLNLEELICLSKSTQQKCYLKTNNLAHSIFDLSQFQQVDEIPMNVVTADISDYVAIYDVDTQSEFLSYRKNQTGRIFRLDKFNYLDINVKFSKPNYYETKYLPNKEAYESALEFHLSDEYLKKYEFVKRLISKLPLFCLQSEYEFQEYSYYICDTDFNVKNAINLREYLKNYHKSFKEIDIDMLIVLLADNFTDLYGCAGDYLFGILAKQFYKRGIIPKILDCKYGLVENFALKTIHPQADYDFIRKDLNCDRGVLMSLLRNSDCVNN